MGQALHHDAAVAAPGGQHVVGVPPPGPALTITLAPPTSSLGPGKKVENLLSRFPKAFVRAGHVIDIRTPLRETLQVGACCCCVINRLTDMDITCTSP